MASRCLCANFTAHYSPASGPHQGRSNQRGPAEQNLHKVVTGFTLSGAGTLLARHNALAAKNRQTLKAWNWGWLTFTKVLLAAFFIQRWPIKVDRRSKALGLCYRRPAGVGTKYEG